MNVPDYLYRGPIDTSYSQRILHSDRIPYYCASCAKSIDAPTGTDRCDACLAAQKVAA